MQCFSPTGEPGSLCTVSYLDISQFKAPAVALLLHYTSMPAGFPSPAADHLEDPIDLHKLLVKTPAATFFVRVQGDSMVDAFIPHKGLLVVDRSLSARSGDIIVAVVNSEFTIKRLHTSDAGVFLLPANEKYRPILVTSDMDFLVWGVVTKVIIDAKEL